MKISNIDGKYFSRKHFFPKQLIFHIKLNNNYDLYRIFETENNGRSIAEMITQVDDIPFTLAGFYPEGNTEPSLKIVKLIAHKREQGIGSKLIKIAIRISEQMGMKGRVHVLSSDIYDKERPPHIFYRKNKFNSKSKNLLKIIDNMIINGKQKTLKFHSIRMFYDPECKVGEFANLPEDVAEEKISLFTKIINKLFGI